VELPRYLHEGVVRETNIPSGRSGWVSGQVFCHSCSVRTDFLSLLMSSSARRVIGGINSTSSLTGEAKFKRWNGLRRTRSNQLWISRITNFTTTEKVKKGSPTLKTLTLLVDRSADDIPLELYTERFLRPCRCSFPLTWG
jgi:hypothetical protein